MMLVCICQPSMLWKLSAWLCWHHLLPYSTTSPSAELCCATHLLYCLQQTSLEFRPDFLSSSSRFSFHSGHVCLEEFLESATRLRISELPYFWMWGKFALDLRRHINYRVAHKELMLQSNLLSRNHLHIHQVCAGSFEITRKLSGLLYYPTCMWWGDCHVSWNMCYQGTGHMLVHIPWSYHPQYQVLACHTHIAAINFFVTGVCTAYVEIPSTTWDEEFWYWDHCCHGPKLVVE